MTDAPNANATDESVQKVGVERPECEIWLLTVQGVVKFVDKDPYLQQQVSVRSVPYLFLPEDQLA